MTNATHHRSMLHAGLALLLLSALTASLRAQDAGVDATGADARAMKVIVTAINGMVQVRGSEDEPWQPAKLGMELTQGAEFRTGPRSGVQFVIPPDQVIILDRLGTMKVLTAIEQAGGKVRTDLGMKYGRTRYNIQAGGGLEHQSTIRSPSATLAVRGTDVTMEDETGFPATAIWHKEGFVPEKQSEAQFTNSEGETSTFGGSDDDSTVNDDNNNPAENSLANTQNTTAGGGLTSVESLLAMTQFGGGAGTGDPTFNDLNSQRQGEQTRTSLVSTRGFNEFAGSMFVELRWFVPIADLDLFVDAVLSNGVTERLGWLPISGRGDYKPAVFSGGRMGLDHTGSASGGIETAQWIGTIPQADFTFGVLHFPDTGTTGVNYDLKVIINEAGQPQRVEQYSGVVGPGEISTHNLRVDATPLPEPDGPAN